MDTDFYSATLAARSIIGHLGYLQIIQETTDYQKWFYSLNQREKLLVKSRLERITQGILEMQSI
jgi:hypothetical protein